MNPDLYTKLAYGAARLMDLDIPHPEIAARTGLTEDNVRAVEDWANDTPVLPVRTQGALTATESLVLQVLIAATEAKLSTGQPKVDIGAETIQGLADTFGAHSDLEMGVVVENLVMKGYLKRRPDTQLLYIPSEENEVEPEFLGPETDDPGVELLDPKAWEGPPSRLVNEFLEQDPSASLLRRILRKDTLRVLMHMDDFRAILDRTAAAGPTGFQERARWPHPGSVYIELQKALPEGAEDYLRVVHGIIITQDFGDDTRGVMIPNTKKDGPGLTGVGLNIKTGELMGVFRPVTAPEETAGLVHGLVAFLTDENNEIVEMPLSRTARRRMERNGQSNPWHVVRRRSGH